MTQMAMLGPELIYGPQDFEIIEKDAIYTCIGCDDYLTAIFKDSIFSHFAHPPNSRIAHQLKHGELCSQMSTSFSNSNYVSDKERQAYVGVWKSLRERVKDGTISQAALLKFMDINESIWKDRLAVNAEYAFINKKREELDYKSWVLSTKEQKLNARVKEIDEQERALNRLALHRNTVDERGSSLIEQIKNALQVAPPFRQEEILERKLSDLI